MKFQDFFISFINFWLSFNYIRNPPTNYPLRMAIRIQFPFCLQQGIFLYKCLTPNPLSFTERQKETSSFPIVHLDDSFEIH